ncbi:hypothetical protein [Amycolatopsis antarctica]|nr:hypothetical protein [Amycolatopsis antarctica]
MSESVVERNRQQQVEWYGEPLSERLGRLLERLDLPQAGLSYLLGLPAPALSQLMSGNRARIGDEAVFSRLRAIEDLLGDPDFERMPSARVDELLATIRSGSGEPRATASDPGDADAGPLDRRAPDADAEPVPAAPPVPQQLPGDPVGTIQALLREVASAAELEAAAATLDQRFPELAEFLRVYGTGRAGDARAHLARTLGS